MRNITLGKPPSPCRNSAPATRDVVLNRALAELIAWQKKYKDLQEFADLFEVVNQTKLKLVGGRSKH